FVDGDATAWSSQRTLIVGANDAAQMIVTGGATIDCVFSVIGDSSRGVGIVGVGGSNSFWRVSSTLTVGNDGVGSLSISGGAKVVTQADVGGNGPYLPMPDSIAAGSDSQGTVT